MTARSFIVGLVGVGLLYVFGLDNIVAFCDRAQAVVQRTAQAVEDR